jgi:hypothetical protein
VIAGDRARPLVAAALLVALLAMGQYWTWLAVNRPDGVWAAMRDPAHNDGADAVITLFEVREVHPDRYLVAKGDRSAWILGDTADVRVGQDISVGGTFRASDSAVLEAWHEIHPLRDGKRYEGIATIGILAIGIPFWFRVRVGRVVERG